MKVEWNGTPESQQRRRGHRPKHREVPAGAVAAKPAASAATGTSPDSTDANHASDALVQPDEATTADDIDKSQLSETIEPARSTAKSRRAARRAKKRKKFRLQRIDRAHEEPNDAVVESIEPADDSIAAVDHPDAAEHLVPKLPLGNALPRSSASQAVTDDSNVAEPVEPTPIKWPSNKSQRSDLAGRRGPQQNSDGQETPTSQQPEASVLNDDGRSFNGKPKATVSANTVASGLPLNEAPAEPLTPSKRSFEQVRSQAGAWERGAPVAADTVAAAGAMATDTFAANAQDEVIADFHAAVEAAEPQAIPPSKWRVRWAAIGVLTIWLVLVGRLVFLQAISQVDLSARARNQRLYVETVIARPGDIVDRHGRLLATTVKSRSLFVDPKRIEKHWDYAMKVAVPLGIEPDSLFERLMQNRDKRFLWIKRRLTEDEAEIVERLELPEGTWGFRVEYLRQYPQGSLAAHVLGLRDIDGIGRGGVEQSCDDLLAGTDGKRVLDRDARGVVVNIRKEIARPPRRGRTVMLTLDSVIQLHTERELNNLVREWRPKSACAIVMDARNGEVLAMTSRPNFDPNLPSEVPDDAWKNHCLSSIYEPGSTIKPLIVSWALEQGLVERGESINCEWGKYKMGRRVLNDHSKYGWLPLKDILVKSSNIGMAKIGERLENKGLYEAVRRFGFGQTTGIELSGELPGLVRTLDQWDPYSTGSVPMGQEIAVTPLQMITAQAALANRGKLPQPHLLLKHYPVLARLNNESPQENVTPKFFSSVVSEDIAKWLVEEPMAQVVTRGTGKRVGVTDYKVFGKTGTSQKIDPATGTYSNTKVVTSFICGAPVESPRVLVFILADEPTAPGLHFGGTVAAPTAGKILNKALIHLRVSPEASN